MRGTALSLVLLSGFLVIGCSHMKTKNGELTSTERARMYVEVANAALLEGDPTGALEQLLMAEAEDSSLPELHHSRALAFAAKGEPAQAMVSAKRAVKLKPDYTDANNTYGKLLLDSGRYEEALDPLTRAANDSINREAYKAFTNLGILQYRQGRMNLARENFDRAIRGAPEMACVAYYYRGHLHLKQAASKTSGQNSPGEYGSAVADYVKASKKYCSNFTEAHLALGIAYEQSKQYQLARAKFLEIQTRYPETQVASQALSHLRTLP